MIGSLFITSSLLALAAGPSVLPATVVAAAARSAHAVDPETGALVPGLGPAQDRDADPRAADRKRVLTLLDGSHVRDRTRFRGDRWERREGREWVPVVGDVTEHVLESDLVARARAMESQLGRDDHSERVVLAAWMVRKGLAIEALAELDRVLAAEPEHSGALQVLREQEFPLEVLAPDATLAKPLTLTMAGAQGSPALREALVWRLARLRDRVDVQRLVAAELTSPSFRRRAFAAFAARRLARAPLQQAITDRAVLDPMGMVREEAALGLRDLEDPQAVAPLVDALGSRFAAVRRNAAESLGNAGYALAVAPLMAHLAHLRASGGGPSGVRANLFVGFHTAYVGDYDVEIAQAASIADPVVLSQASGVVFDVRAQAQISRDVTLMHERREVLGALRKLTGEEKLGDDPDAWLRWWETNRRRFEPPPPPPAEAAPAQKAPADGEAPPKEPERGNDPEAPPPVRRGQQGGEGAGTDSVD